MNSKKTLLAALLAALMLTSGCGSSASQQQTDTAAQTGETGASNVASASDMAEVEEVVEEGMTPPFPATRSRTAPTALPSSPVPKCSTSLRAS